MTPANDNLSFYDKMASAWRNTFDDVLRNDEFTAATMLQAMFDEYNRAVVIYNEKFKV